MILNSAHIILEQKGLALFGGHTSSKVILLKQDEVLEVKII